MKREKYTVAFMAKMLHAGLFGNITGTFSKIIPGYSMNDMKKFKDKSP